MNYFAFRKIHGNQFFEDPQIQLKLKLTKVMVINCRKVRYSEALEQFRLQMGQMKT